jgi:hypothetical protein
MLTDDLLVLHHGPEGLQAYPGPPRIKLFPEVAKYFLGEATVGVPMNAETAKLVLPLCPSQCCLSPKPVRAIYVLGPPSEGNQTERFRIESLSKREAFLALVRNTFNYVITDADRLRRQFTETMHLVTTVQVKELHYPRRLDCLADLHEAILSDLNKTRMGKGQIKR